MLTPCRSAISLQRREQLLEQGPSRPRRRSCSCTSAMRRCRARRARLRCDRDSAPKAARRAGCRRRAGCMPVSRQNDAIAASGRRSTSEYCTWFETTRMPWSAMTRRRSVSKLVSARWRILPSSLQVGEVLEGVEITVVAVVPPVKLQQVERFHPHPRQRDPDRVLDDAPRHPAGVRHPFGERLDLGERSAPRSAANRRRKAPTKSSAGP